MAYVMFGNFASYPGWQTKIITLCKAFYEKYDVYPDFIRMKEKTMDALFDESELAFENPYSEEHCVRDSKGNLLIPVQMENNDDIHKPENLLEADDSSVDEYFYDDFWEDYESFDDNDDFEKDEIYPVQFGANDEGIVSFITNKFELKFLEGEDLPDDYFIIQYGDGPGDDDGEDLEDEEDTEQSLKINLVA